MSNLVKEYREAFNIKQSQLAEELKEICPGIDAPLISKFEKGSCLPTVDVQTYLENRLASQFAETFISTEATITSSIENVLKESFLANTIFREILKGTEDNPITKDHLRAVTGKSERDVRNIVSQLRLAGARIGTSSGNRGYWLCETDSQYKSLRNEYLGRIKTYAAIVGAMDRNTKGQIEMEILNG